MRMTTGLALGLLVLMGHAAAGNAARGYLKLASAYEADCVLLQGRMRQLVNTSPDRAIEAYLYRYMGKHSNLGAGSKSFRPGASPLILDVRTSPVAVCRTGRSSKPSFRNKAL